MLESFIIKMKLRVEFGGLKSGETVCTIYIFFSVRYEFPANSHIDSSVLSTREARNNLHARSTLIHAGVCGNSYEHAVGC